MFAETSKPYKLHIDVLSETKLILLMSLHCKLKIVNIAHLFSTGFPEPLLMVVGGTKVTMNTVNTVELLPLDSVNNSKCLKSKQNPFPGTLTGAMGASLGKST